MQPEIEQMQYFRQGYRLYQQGDVEGSLQFFRKVIEMDDIHFSIQNVDPLYLSFYGVALAIAKKDTRNGKKLCEKALKNGQSNPEVFLNLGRVYEEIRDFRKAADTYRRGYRVHKRNTLLLESLQRVSPRGRSIVPFLPRDSFMNKYLGKFFKRLFHRPGS